MEFRGLRHGIAGIVVEAGTQPTLAGARWRVDAALEAAEDCQVAWLQVGRAVRRDEAQHDVRERRRHGRDGGLAGVDAGQVVQGDRELQERRRSRDVTSVPRPGLTRQDGACLARPAPACPRRHGPC